MITTTQIILLFISSLAMVGALTPVMRMIAIKIDFVDRPNSTHKTHSEAIPYLGGVAIILGVTIVVYSTILTQNNLKEYFWIATSLFGPAVLLGFVGLIDDRISLKPLPRFIAQSTAGIFTATLIIATNTMGNPTGNFLIDIVITILWFVGISNAINFFDNLDGGAAGAVAASSFGLFAITQANGQFLIAATSISLFGAMCGFLIWNKNPARIYMGDAGSLFLGTVLATLTLRLDPDTQSKTISLAIPFLLLAVPILDTSVAVISRIRRKKSIFAGGKDHLSHRLLRQHFSKRQSALLLWGIAAIFVGMSMKLALMSSGAMFLLYFAVIFWVALLISFLRCRDE